MGMDDYEAEIYRVCGILERIAEGFAPGSGEALAIRDAALAYTIVQQRKNLQKSHAKLLAAFGGQLTDEKKNDLRRQGIDPDELEDEEPLP